MARMPQVTARELARFLKSQGYTEQRQSGSHLTLFHVGRDAPVTVPAHTGGASPADDHAALRVGILSILLPRRCSASHRSQSRCNATQI